MATLTGCIVGSDDDDPFGSATTPMTSTPPGDGSGDSGSSGGSMGSSGAEGGSTDGGSTGPVTMTTDMTMDGGSSSSDGGGNGMQPTEGMYSMCATGADCTQLCITIQDEKTGMVQGGFCSAFPCVNAATDCDPSPGGTAVPACLGIELNMMPETACYLNCAGGATCPPPMTCTPVVGGLEVCV